MTKYHYMHYLTSSDVRSACFSTKTEIAAWSLTWTCGLVQVSRDPLPNPMLYLCRESSSDVQMLAKFATRYGLDVHRAWAAKGLAPRLLHTEVVDSADPLQLVIMEWLPEAYCSLDQLPLDQLQSAGSYIWEALQSAHGIFIDGQCFAHGDARLPNVSVKQEGQQWRVQFLDFDWAGVAGTHCYPLFMNSSIQWPAGATPLGIMLQQHDVALLRGRGQPSAGRRPVGHASKVVCMYRVGYRLCMLTGRLPL